MFSRESLQLLGLSATENRVLTTLRKGDTSVSGLSRTTNISRTSLYPILNRLKKRGLITTTRRGKRQRWKAVSDQKMQQKLFTLAHQQEQIDESGEQVIGIVPSQQSEYKVYAGREKLVQIYEDLGRLPRNSRLAVIQPNVSAYSVMKQFPYKRLVKLNQAIKDRKIIVEAILQENFLDYYIARLKKEGKNPKQILKAYGGRLAVTTYVPEDRLDFDSEITLYENTVIIANWPERVAVVIKSAEVAGIIRELFESLKELGKRVDQNPRVAEILEKED